MATHLTYHQEYHFYLIGNTSAECMTRDLAPEEPARILLLGCGDPKKVLFTVFCEPLRLGRSLDFTCVDREPGILARNALLYSMVADKVPYKTTLWNIFYHAYLDTESYDVLIEQCRKLLRFSNNIADWNSSPYAHFLRMCTEYTLSEVRRYWQLYVDMEGISQRRKDTIREAYTKRLKHYDARGAFTGTPLTAGPWLYDALSPSGSHNVNYWQTGTTYFDAHQIAEADRFNPTFVYSMAGEGCEMDRTTDPLPAYHFLPLFANSTKPDSISAVDLIKAARGQFTQWCTAFYEAITSPSYKRLVVRLILGDVMAVSRTLHHFAQTGALGAGLPSRPWRISWLELSEEEYLHNHAPGTFNAIDTSNLIDHLGLLNILICAAPLLDPFDTAVLYTEVMGQKNRQRMTVLDKELHADYAVVALLLGLVPVDYLSGFTTRCNTAMSLATKLHSDIPKRNARFHRFTTWRSPKSTDTKALHRALHVVFEPEKLASLLFHIYYSLFSQKVPMYLPMSHCTRESFVLLLKIVKSRLAIADEQWKAVMKHFLAQEDSAQHSKMFDPADLQDSSVHLYLHGIHKFNIYSERLQPIGRFSGWKEVPNIVRVFLKVPRDKLTVLNELKISDGLQNVQLQGGIRGSTWTNFFSATSAAFGTIKTVGSKDASRVEFEEDARGWQGTSPLVVSFIIPTWTLTKTDPPEILKANFGLRMTGDGLQNFKLLGGGGLYLFEARVMDRSSVHIVRDAPLPHHNPMAYITKAPSPEINDSGPHIGEIESVVVGLNQKCQQVERFSSRLYIEDEILKKKFADGVTPETTQESPCTVTLALDDRKQDFVFPYPVIGSACQLKFARKTGIIELVVPVYTPFKTDGLKLTPFPVTVSQKLPLPYNFEHINLGRMPVMEMPPLKGGAEAAQNLSKYVYSTVTEEEESSVKNGEPAPWVTMKLTIVNIHLTLAAYKDLPHRKIFVFKDKLQPGPEFIFFFTDMKLDVSFHSTVCDGFVLPITDNLEPSLKQALLHFKEDTTTFELSEPELRLWRQLLPALAERCRAWKHKPNCEYKAKGITLSPERHRDPLCSCGKGKDTNTLAKRPSWKPFVPYVTRIALSPLYASLYVELIPDDGLPRCAACGTAGRSKYSTCTVCRTVLYCGPACQKKHWKEHFWKCPPPEVLAASSPVMLVRAGLIDPLPALEWDGKSPIPKPDDSDMIYIDY